MNSHFIPRHGNSLLAVVAIGAALAYAVTQEQPRGRLTGVLSRFDTGAELPFARVVAYSENGTFNARADARGRYVFAGLPAGDYEVSGYSRHEAFEASTVKTTVDESQTTTLPLPLKRARPDLQLGQQQQVFLPSEKPVLPLHGYADPARPKGTDTLRLRVWKTRHSHMMNDGAVAEAFGRVGYRWNPPKWLPKEVLNPPGQPAPKLISDSQVKISEADVEGFYHKRLPLPVRGTGVYLVQIEHREGKALASVCAWVNVTGTALVVKRAGAQTLAFVTDLKTGAPVSGAKVTFYFGRSTEMERTDSDGLAETDSQIESRFTTVAQRGDDEAVLSPNGGDEENRGSIVTHVYTDRPIYRPGQTVSFKGISRKRESMVPMPLVLRQVRVSHLGEFSTSQRFCSPYQQAALVEVRDPTGVQIFTAIKPSNDFGSFAGDFELSPEAPTGNYSLITTIEGQESTTDITVASYRKPEFEVTATPEKVRYVPGEAMRFAIDAKYYFGTPVAGAKVTYEIYRGEDWSGGGDEDGYEYEGEDYGGYGVFIRDGEGRLDANGHLTVNFPARSAEELDEKTGTPNDNPVEERPQIFTAHVTVTDAAERQVEGEGRTTLTAGDFALSVRPQGYLAKPGEPMNLDVVARDFDGKPVAGVPIRLETGYWKYEAAKSEYESPQRSSYINLGSQNAVTNVQGVAAMQAKVPRNGEFSLIAHAQDAAKRPVRGSAEIWAADDSSADEFGWSPRAELALFADKKSYTSGETARVLISTSAIGQSVLLTVEGERIYRSFVVPIKKRGTVLKVPLDSDYGPNVFLSACYVRDKNMQQSELPLRVAVPERTVNVKVTADKSSYAPGEAIVYDVATTDSKNRPVAAEFSLGVVDESIYALREDHPEEISATFYPQRQNNVRTSFSFEREYLGDASKAAPKIEPRRKFLDTAFWQPFAQTDASGKARLSFRLPDNLTKWRATAIAQTRDTAFGFTTQKVLASKKFFVRLEKPRFLTQRDRSRLLAFVHNETGAPLSATVQLQLNGLETTQTLTQSVTVEAGRATPTEWPVSATALDGAQITLSAWTGDRKFTDAIEERLPLRAHGRTVLWGEGGFVDGGGPRSVKLNFDSNALPAASRVTVRLTPSVISALTGGLEYLTGFPYGCVEQTMSRFLPDILVSRVLQKSGTLDPRSKKLQSELPAMVRDGLTRLYSMQNESGGWGWWSHDANSSWMTSYVLYGLAEARQAGYVVDETKFANGRKAALEMLPAARGLHRAFLLYSLSLCATGDELKPLRIERGKTDWKGWDGEAMAYLMMADRKLNFYDAKAPAAFERRAVNADGMTHWVHWDDAKKIEPWQYDCTNVTATAAGLRAALAANPRDPRVPGALRWLMNRRTGEYWNSTRDTSFVLSALCDYLEATPNAANLTGEVSVALGKKTLRRFALTPQAGREPDLQVEIPATQLRAGLNQISFTRNGGGSPVFFSVQSRQVLAGEDIVPLRQKELSVKREYFVTGQKNPVSGPLPQGANISVKLTFNSPREMAYVIIEDPFPAGCETTERGTAATEISEEWRYGYATVDVGNIDVRDDRIAFFCRKIAPGPHTIEYHLRAQTPGNYHVLPAQVQAMYDPATQAESAEGRIEVR